MAKKPKSGGQNYKGLKPSEIKKLQEEVDLLINPPEFDDFSMADPSLQGKAKAYFDAEEEKIRKIMEEAEARAKKVVPGEGFYDDMSFSSGFSPREPGSGEDYQGAIDPPWTKEQKKAHRQAEAARKAAKAAESEARAKVVDEKMGAWSKKKGFATNLRVKARKMMGAGGRAAWKKGSWLNPMSLKGGLLFGALPFATDFVKNSVTGTKEMFGVGSQMFDGVSAIDEMLDQQNAMATVNRIQEKRRQRVEALRAQNRMRLMQTSPHLAQSLLAGQELPTDGIVIGGRPRVDLLDQVADQMGAGAFPAPGEME